jgi:hypothetical protein
MEYYRSNAVYDAILNSNQRDDFTWAAENAWILVYGTAEAAPLLIALVFGMSSGRNQVLFDTVRTLSRITNTPGIAIEFDDTETEISTVQLWKSIHDSTIVTATLEDLKRHFQTLGLAVSSTPIGKAINDKSSSAYHNWQRSSLGGSITVSDLDLIRLGPNEFIEVLELKRSFYPVESWQPYRDDFRNFQLISNLLNGTGIRFHIAYNQRVKTPYKDDASRISVFEFRNGQPPTTLKLGIYTIIEFLSGEHLPE